MSAALYRLRIGWAGRFTGSFRISSAPGTPVSPNSKIAPLTTSTGYDIISDIIGNPVYGGTYDTIADDEYVCLNFTLARGRDDPFANMLSSQLDVELNAVYPGRYNPKNPNSPLCGLILPMRPCSLDVSLDSWSSYISLFNGWLDEAGSDVDWDAGSAKLTFKDLFLWLDTTKNATIAPTGPTTVGAVIGLLLDADGWSAS